MPNNLSEELRQCFQHAADCAWQAAAQTDPKMKEDFFVMERSWLSMARQILTHFSDQKRAKTDKIAQDLEAAISTRR